MTMGERLRALRKRSGLSQFKLGQKVGADANTVSRWENDKIEASHNYVVKLADALGTTADYLLGRDAALPESNVRPIRGGVVEVPVLGAQSSICCGGGYDISEIDEEVIRMELVPEAWLTGPRGDRPFYITYVEGDSMEPTIEDGERVLVNPNQTPMQGEIAVVSWSGHAMLKGVIFERNGDVRLVSANKEYPERVIPKEDVQHVLDFRGVVIRALGKDRPIRGVL